MIKMNSPHSHQTGTPGSDRAAGTAETTGAAAAANTANAANAGIDEPLSTLLKTVGTDISSIAEIVCGQKYSAVLLKNGNIGVCANLSHKCSITPADLVKPDLADMEQRIILTAYLNAQLNYLHATDKETDIFTAVDFSTYRETVMIGLFRPLLEKFNRQGLTVHVFDRIKQCSVLTPLAKQAEYIAKADAVILSATAIWNGTFMETIEKTGNHCDIFILGPSAVMSPHLFKYRNVRQIFGAIFEKHDQRVLQAIRQGHGTKTFMTFGKKVSLLEEKN